MFTFRRLRISKWRTLVSDPQMLAPTQVVISKRKRPNTFAGNLEYGLGNSGRDLRNCLLADPGNPFVVGFQEGDVDLRRIVRHAGNLKCIKIALHHASVLDRDFLPHRITKAPSDLPLDLLAHGKRIDEREALV